MREAGEALARPRAAPRERGARPVVLVFSILRYARGPERKARFYLSLQAPDTFDPDRRIRSYRWTRVGVDRRGTQFGLGVNFDGAGPNPRAETSLGVFVRRDVF